MVQLYCSSKLLVTQNSNTVQPINKGAKIMTEIICTNALCKFCLYNHCENPKVKSEIANILTILKIEIQSCKGYVKEEDLIDPHS